MKYITYLLLPITLKYLIKLIYLVTYIFVKGYEIYVNVVFKNITCVPN